MKKRLQWSEIRNEIRIPSVGYKPGGKVYKIDRDAEEAVFGRLLSHHERQNLTNQAFLEAWRER